MIMSTLTAFENSCRACLRVSKDSYCEMKMQCPFSSDDQSLCDVFNFCTRLQTRMNDDFPQKICVICIQDLQNTYTFLKKVLANNKKLNDLKDHDNGKENTIFGDNESLKDPLENLTDNEDNDDHSEFIEEEKNDDGKFRNLFDADNTIEDPQVNDNVISPLYGDSNDKENDFFRSLELQIFPQGRLQCKICGKAYFTAVGLQAHMDIHLPKRKFSKTSLIVGKCLKKERKLKRDVSDENCSAQNIKLLKGGSKSKPKPKKMFPCEVCSKQMISASKLRYHMVMHTGEKDYLCTMCPKAYSTIYALKHHMRAHTGERPYECKFCGDRFLRPTTLKSHMRRHTGERPYGCDICGKRFIQHSSMATHIKLNHMDKTISCPYCDKKYARQTDLNTHLLSHSGDKPFACQICPSRFTRQSNLNKHINQHHSNTHLEDKKIKNKVIHEAVSDNNCKNKIFPVEMPSCSSNLE